MAITRIKNNQIIDSGIWANSKIIPGSIVGSLFNSDITVTSDFTITGNLVVQGATQYTTLATTNTYVNDPLMVVNNDFSGTNTADLGIVFNRGSDTNQAVIWDESGDEFAFTATTEDGTTSGDTAISSYAGLHVGTLKSSDLTSTRVTYATTDGALTDSANMTFDGTDLTVASAIVSDLTAGRVTFAGTSGALEDAEQLTYASSALTVNQLVLDGTAAGVTISTIAASGEDIIISADSGAVDFDGGTATNLADPTLDSDAVTLGYLNSAISSEVTNIQLDDTDITIYDDGTNPGWIEHNVDGTLVANVTATTVTLTQPTSLTDTTSSTTTSSGALIVSGGVGVAENITAGGQLKLTDATDSTNVTTGTIITAGGVGIAKNLNVGGNVVVTGDMTVQGTTTTVNSTEVTIADLNLTVASGATTSAEADGAGLTVAGASATFQYTHATTSWDLNKITKVTDTTDSTSPTTGALLTAGGLGVAKDLFVGGGDLGTDQTTFNLINTTATTLNIGGAATTLELGAASGTTSVNNNLAVDGTLDVTGATNLNDTTGSTSNTTGALIVDGGLGLAENLHMGGLADIDGALTVGGAVNFDDTTTSTSNTTGALVVDGGLGLAENLHMGGLADIDGALTVGGATNIDDTTDSTSITTGALIVDGGAGLAKSVNVGEGLAVNTTNADKSFVVSGVGSNDGLIVANGGKNAVTFSDTGNATIQDGTIAKFDSAGAILLPRGSSAERPGSAGNVDVGGMIRFSTTSNQVEFYNGASWQTAGSEFTVIASNNFNGDGSTTAFTLSGTASTAGTFVAVNGIVQQPTNAYSVSGTTLTFTEAPETGDVIEARVITTTSQVTSIGSGNGYNTFDVQTVPYANITAGTSSATVRVSVDGAEETFGLVNGTKQSYNQTAVAVGTSATTVDSFDATKYRSAEYVVQSENAAGDAWELTKVLLIHDGTTATIVEYGTVGTDSDTWTLSATISGGSVLLQSTAGEASTSVKVKASYIV